MSEPFLERLTRFTPDAGGLDRDALLFAAGRGSARPNRVWIALAATLAVTQVLTLALWWSQPGPIAQAPSPAPPHNAAPSPAEPPISDSTEDPGMWSAYHVLRESELDTRPNSPSTGKYVESGPPLRAFPSRQSSIWNGT
jgi:hypothetical protein